jgi:hypothetical protein
MALFPYSFRKVFVGTGVMRTSGTTGDLKPGELGLFDANTYSALGVGATFSTNRSVLLAQGSFHTKDVLALGHGGYKESIKSQPIEGHFISSFRVALPKRAKQHVVAVGYDGVDTSKTLTLRPDEVATLRLEIKGSPVNRFINHNLYQDFMVKPDSMVADCDVACDTLAPCFGPINRLANEINSHPYFSKFVKAEALLSCDPALTINPDNIVVNRYELVLCDEGDGIALSRVQSQYPSLSVSRKSRVGSVSTYELCGATLPAAFDPAALRVVPNCATCPSGYTLNATMYKFEITRVDAGNSGALSTVNTDYSTTTAVRVSFDAGTSTYVIYKTSATVPTAVGTDVVVSTGTTIQAVCVQDTPAADVAWVLGEARYKTSRTLTLTVSKTCGGANRLADIKAAYAGVAAKLVGGVDGITVLTAGDCADIYTVHQFNEECLLDPCGAEDTPTFVDLQAFEGITWDVVPASIPDGTDCSCGLRLTSAYVDTVFGNCSFEPTDNVELDIPRIIVSQVAPLTAGWAVTELQAPQAASGVGETVLRELITFMGYKKEDYFCDPRMRETQDLQPVLDSVKRDQFYKIYYITHNVPYRSNKTNLFNNEQYELMVAFPETVDTTSFENVLNGYITSMGVQLKAI